jgi:L-ribulose-5-phosphate 4-epimerase
MRRWRVWDRRRRSRWSRGCPGGPLDSAGAVVEVIKERPDTQAVLLGNHGVLAFGPDAETAVSLLVALHEAAEAELRAAAIGGAGPA